MKKFLTDFKAFAMRGNVIDMAIGVVIGTAFGKITSSLVSDIFMPVLGILTGGINLSGLFYALDGQHYASAQEAAAAGAGTLNYGLFLQNVLDFLLIALCMFLVVRVISRIKRLRSAPEPAKPVRLCPYCRQEVAQDATRCPHCTSMLE